MLSLLNIDKVNEMCFTTLLFIHRPKNKREQHSMNRTHFECGVIALCIDVVCLSFHFNVIPFENVEKKKSTWTFGVFNYMNYLYKCNKISNISIFDVWYYPQIEASVCIYFESLTSDLRVVVYVYVTTVSWKKGLWVWKSINMIKKNMFLCWKWILWHVLPRFHSILKHNELWFMSLRMWSKVKYFCHWYKMQ